MESKEKTLSIQALKAMKLQELTPLDLQLTKGGKDNDHVHAHNLDLNSVSLFVGTLFVLLLGGKPAYNRYFKKSNANPPLAQSPPINKNGFADESIGGNDATEHASTHAIPYGQIQNHSFGSETHPNYDSPTKVSPEIPINKNGSLNVTKDIVKNVRLEENHIETLGYGTCNTQVKSEPLNSHNVSEITNRKAPERKINIPTDYLKEEEILKHQGSSVTFKPQKICKVEVSKKDPIDELFASQEKLEHEDQEAMSPDTKHAITISNIIEYEYDPESSMQYHKNHIYQPTNFQESTAPSTIGNDKKVKDGRFADLSTPVLTIGGPVLYYPIIFNGRDYELDLTQKGKDPSDLLKDKPYLPIHIKSYKQIGGEVIPTFDYKDIYAFNNLSFEEKEAYILNFETSVDERGRYLAKETLVASEDVLSELINSETFMK